MPVPVHWIDAFTDRPFAGNPAAVCLLPRPAADGWMQDVAREMNLSETAFLVARHDPVQGWDLRWFSPATEVELCGHATLASAHFLWSEGHLAADCPARFHTRSGELGARRASDPAGEWITLDFPSRPPRPLEPPPELAAALGAEPRWTGAADRLDRTVDLLVELADEATVRGLAPDFAALARVPSRGVVVTAAAEPRRNGRGVDFVSRGFFPAVGIDEDPVTGSAHCVLAPFWAVRFGRDELVGYQASARGGTVRVRVVGDRVELTGQAVTVARGELVTESGAAE